ncbi:DUF3311 domain-containing protein [Nocardia seriolae]|nr:DUF3311 domain-containing protein [Nocardia seriolae]MTJ74225.1 DUF3311 domain-containing protein [Nocardia seriolae]MTJ87117.1 DUF3311 domain-containing protein [Nocardia seriolae]MTK40158.1 DUF3311 domain-containing protein [Nocardia seriolae]MTK47685.1 DUF3311 domain-containing protein [Nocardia seriolae]
MVPAVPQTTTPFADDSTGPGSPARVTSTPSPVNTTGKSDVRLRISSTRESSSTQAPDSRDSPSEAPTFTCQITNRSPAAPSTARECRSNEAAIALHGRAEQIPGYVRASLRQTSPEPATNPPRAQTVPTDRIGQPAHRPRQPRAPASSCGRDRRAPQPSPGPRRGTVRKVSDPRPPGGPASNSEPAPPTATPLAERGPALLLLSLPGVPYCLAPVVANRIEPRILGIPFLIAYLVAVTILTGPLIWFVARRDPANRSVAPEFVPADALFPSASDSEAEDPR